MAGSGDSGASSYLPQHTDRACIYVLAEADRP